MKFSSTTLFADKEISYKKFEITNMRGYFQHDKDRPLDYHQNIPCKINQEVRKNVGLPSKREDNISCMQHGDDVYLPFSFIQKYFDVSLFECFPP